MQAEPGLLFVSYQRAPTNESPECWLKNQVAIRSDLPHVHVHVHPRYDVWCLL